MKISGKGVVAASIALVILMSFANAQIMRGGQKHQATSSRGEKATTDKKASDQAVGTLLDKSYDPWSTLR